ncbi:MAG TPA: hypothetical protein VLV78_18035 [Thermoanaerobaculia bacterium]|nr:hypothetical protein [Thermoanaerobaculia bacterium]
MTSDDKAPIAMSIDQIKAEAADVAGQMKGAGAGPLPRDLRERFIHVRTALLQRGIHDPVLIRFDSATVPQASAIEVAEQLSAVAASL